MATTSNDPNLGRGPSEDSEISLNESDSGSLLSEDSVFPHYDREETDKGTAKTLYEACARNEDWTLCKILERGVTREEVMELDINGRVRSLILLLYLAREEAPLKSPWKSLFQKQNKSQSRNRVPHSIYHCESSLISTLCGFMNVFLCF